MMRDDTVPGQRRLFQRLVGWPVLSALAFGSIAPGRGAEALPPDFSRDVRPIFAENCFKCHGPDDKGRKAGLRLDRRDAALKGGKSELPAIVPGQPAESEVMLRVTSQDEDEVMPPRDTHKTLSPAQIETLRRWIESGAEYR
ncbi:MAG: c-type cytochrome domain-containing protein, partial [Opitutaceae bacterium]